MGIYSSYEMLVSGPPLALGHFLENPRVIAPSFQIWDPRLRDLADPAEMERCRERLVEEDMQPGLRHGGTRSLGCRVALPVPGGRRQPRRLLPPSLHMGDEVFALCRLVRRAGSCQPRAVVRDGEHLGARRPVSG